MCTNGSHRASIPRKKSQVGISLRDVVKEQIGYIEKNKEALLEFAKYMVIYLIPAISDHYLE